MKTETKRAGKFYLKWPWNLALYVVLALLLRLYAIPVILLLMAWNKKQQPNGPEEGYCLQRTRRRLSRLIWAVLFLLFGAAGGFVFVDRLMDRASLDVTDYATIAIAGLICLGCIAGGIYEAYTGLRDALFPEKSLLARSIRSQLPYPDEAPGVKELFAMVDRDIKENGQWFDRVAVGKEWVLGDEVSAISRIRVVFGRNEVRHHHSGGRVQTARIIELYIMDDRRQVQLTSLRDASELAPLLNCLKLRAPEALFRPYREYTDYCGKSDEQWQELERAFQLRRSQRTQEQARATAGSNPHFTLTDLLGQRTSRFTAQSIAQQLQGLQQHGQRFALEPVEPIAAGSFGQLVRMECGVTNAGLTLIAVLRQPDGKFLARALPAEEESAQSLLSAMLETRQLPDLSAWQPLQAVSDQQPPARPQFTLTLTDQTGAVRDYTAITRRDVELAADGLASGKYSVVCLRNGSHYVHLQAGSKEDGRVTASAIRPEPDVLRGFETKCTSRQAQTWLLELADGKFNPDFSQWKDITKRLQEQAKQNKK